MNKKIMAEKQQMRQQTWAAQGDFVSTAPFRKSLGSKEIAQQRVNLCRIKNWESFISAQELYGSFPC